MQPLLAGLARAVRLRASGGMDRRSESRDGASATTARCCGSGRRSTQLRRQSFNPAELATLERHHDPADVDAQHRRPRGPRAFSRLNVDLIYAIPGQDLASWSESLDAAIALEDPPRLLLQPHVRAQHADGRQQAAGTFRAGRRKTSSCEMLHHTARTPRRRRVIARTRSATTPCPARSAGTTSFTGPAATTSAWARRRRRTSRAGGGATARTWASGNARSQPARCPPSDVEHLSPDQRAGELAMLMLRLDRGIEFDAFADSTGRDARAALRRPDRPPRARWD